MSSRVILVQKAVRKICQDPLFVNRWVLLPSLHQALRSKFKYNEKDISLITLSKSIGKIDPNIDSLNMLHDSGFYRAKNGNIRCIFFQDPPKKEGSAIHPEMALVNPDTESLGIFESAGQSIRGVETPLIFSVLLKVS